MFKMLNPNQTDEFYNNFEPKPNIEIYNYLTSTQEMEPLFVFLETEQYMNPNPKIINKIV